MADVVVTSPASVDVDGILSHLLQRAGQGVVDDYRFDFRAAFRHLAVHSEIGAPRPNLGRGTRLAMVDPYVVLHRYDRAADTVFVLRVLHGRRRLSLDAP